MADLRTYMDLDEKKKYFSNGNSANFKIDKKEELDLLLNQFEEENDYVNPTMFIYRGLTEANYKLYTSAQRLWLENEYQQWANKNYLEFVNGLVQSAKSNSLIKKVFDLHNYSNSERELPILSILQHYGAPTPLMDWSYNKYVACFFAIDGLKLKMSPKKEIDNYFSIYSINKEKYLKEFMNIIDFLKTKYPSIEKFYRFVDDEGSNENAIFYISDFENQGLSIGTSKSFNKLLIRTNRPITTVFNQNIIPQEGLFIFNPFSTKTLEDIFNVNVREDGWSLSLKPFECYNINKGLGEYLRRKIDVKHNIDNNFIYPDLYKQIKKIKEIALNRLIQ